jgi:molybdopterin converting factor subunit 1
VQVQVLLFASYADAFGVPEVMVTLDDGASVKDLLAHVRQLVAGQALPPTPLVALNQRYARSDERIRPGDEVAIIPPVAGG